MVTTIILPTVCITLCVTLIICVALYAICKMARQDEKKKQEKQKEIQVPQFANSGSSQKNIKPIRSQQEADLREYVEERVRENEKQ